MAWLNNNLAHKLFDAISWKLRNIKTNLIIAK